MTMSDKKKLKSQLISELAAMRQHMAELERITYEQRSAGEALRSSEERYRAVVEDQTEVITRFKADGTITFVNDVFCRFFGKKQEELVGHSWHSEAVVEDIPMIEQRLRTLSLDNPVVVIENRVYSGTGHVRCMQFVNRGFFDAEGLLVETQAVGRDVTERKRAEEALRAASLYSRKLIETSLDPLVTISSGGKITDVNTATEKITGMSREGLIGSDFADYFTEPERARAGYLKVFEQGQVIDYPLTIRHTSGAVTEVLYNASVYRNEQGEVNGVFAAARDITGRKRTEEALRASEQKYRTLFEESFDGLFITSPAGKILDMNKKGILMFGYDTKEEILNLDLERDVYACPPDREWILAMVSAQGTAEYEVVVKKKSGEQMMTHCSLTAVREEQGVITAYRGIIRDITERKRAEEALRSVSLYMRSLIEASLDPFVTISPDGKITDVNQATESVAGVPRERLIGRDFSDYFTEPEKARDGYHTVLVDGLVRDYPLTIRHTSGKTTDVLYNATVYRNGSGEMQGVFAAARDVTERKRAEEALRQSERRKTILNRIANVFLTVPDVETYGEVLTIVLDEMESKYGVFGFIADNGDLVVPSMTKEIWCDCQVPNKTIVFPSTTWGDSIWGRAIREQKTFYSDGPFHIPDGHIHINSFLTAPIVFGNKTIGLLSVANRVRGYTEEDKDLLESITHYISPILNARLQRDQLEKERKLAEDEIHKLNQELEQRVAERTAQLKAANNELEAFAYSISHDLRAPLRHIDGFLELLQERIAATLDEQSRHYMATISDSARRMGMLIDDLLSFSRMGRYEMSKFQVDLGVLVQEVIRELEPETHDRAIHWRIEDLPVVTGDRAMLRIVLVNLISNALKFTRPCPQPEIEIGCLPSRETQTTVFVRDNGVGFDMKYADKLFGVFQRLHRTDEFEGVGIGLANVRRIIKRHGGKTWAEGQLNQGATVYFSLPQPNQ